MALVAERRYGKDEILENYLNEIYFGQNGLQGIYGVWEASDFYFARPPQELSVGDIALLAGLIRAPNALSPFRDPERARQRRDTVLRLHARRRRDRRRRSTTPPSPSRCASPPCTRAATPRPNFVDFLREDLSRNYPRERADLGGARHLHQPRRPAAAGRRRRGARRPRRARAPLSRRWRSATPSTACRRR